MSRWVNRLILFISFYSQTSMALMIHRLGSETDVRPNIDMAVCLAGGGSDQAWVEGWKLLIKNTHGGDIVIIQSDKKSHDYADWIFYDQDQNHFAKVNSITTISIDHKSDSFNPEVLQLVQNAEFVFFSGGDQSKYIQYIDQTPLEQILNQHLKSHTALFAGTSAGMAVLAGIDYRARFGSPHDPEDLVSANDVLNDPTGSFVDLDDHFLIPPYLKNIITETHFAERDRFGRIVGFMANAIYRQWSNYDQIQAIAADAGTTFCYNSQGVGQVYGEGQVYFLKANTSPEVLQPSSPLTWIGPTQNSVEVQILNQNTSGFNIQTWQTIDPAQIEYWWVEQGQLFKRSK